MQNEDVIADLKQFIAATVSQATAGMVTNDDLTKQLGNLQAGMSKRFDELDSKMTTIADAHAEQLDDHELRLKKLEQQIV